MNKDYTSLIQQQLDRLVGLKSQRKQREETIRAFAEATARGESTTPLFGKKVHGTGIKVIALRTFYHKEKDWYHNPLFKEVLDNVTTLYIQRDNEEREALEADARRRRHEERVALIRVSKANLLLIQEKMREQLVAGDIALTPSQVGNYMKIVFGEERAEFDELPTQRTAVDVEGETTTTVQGNPEQPVMVAFDPATIPFDVLVAIALNGDGPQDDSEEE